MQRLVANYCQTIPGPSEERRGNAVRWWRGGALRNFWVDGLVRESAAEPGFVEVEVAVGRYGKMSDVFGVAALGGLAGLEAKLSHRPFVFEVVQQLQTRPHIFRFFVCMICGIPVNGLIIVDFVVS